MPLEAHFISTQQLMKSKYGTKLNWQLTASLQLHSKRHHTITPLYFPQWCFVWFYHFKENLSVQLLNIWYQFSFTMSLFLLIRAQIKTYLDRDTFNQHFISSVAKLNLHCLSLLIRPLIKTGKWMDSQPTKGDDGSKLNVFMINNLSCSYMKTEPR